MRQFPGHSYGSERVARVPGDLLFGVGQAGRSGDPLGLIDSCGANWRQDREHLVAWHTVRSWAEVRVSLPAGKYVTSRLDVSRTG